MQEKEGKPLKVLEPFKKAEENLGSPLVFLNPLAAENNPPLLVPGAGVELWYGPEHGPKWWFLLALWRFG